MSERPEGELHLPHRNRSSVSFVLLSDLIPASELIERTGLRADEVWEKGRMISPETTKASTYRLNGISVDSGEDRYADVSRQIEIVLAKLQPFAMSIRQVVAEIREKENREDCARLWVSTWKNRPSLELDIDPATLLMLGELGSWLGLSLRFYDEV